MASDLSGYQGAAGKQRWMQESGGDENAYNRENSGYQQAQPPQAPAMPPGRGTAQPRNSAPAAPAAPQPAQQQQNAPGLMDYNTWFNEGNKEKGDWKPGAQSQQAYEAYKFRANNPNIPGGKMGDDNIGNAYSKGGDATGMRAKSRQLGMSEDFDRIDEATLNSWEAQKDTNCPPNMPYQAYDGSGCIEKPIDSNKGGGGEGGGGGGGGQGGGRGQGGGGGQGGGQGGLNQWNNPIYNYLAQRGMNAANDPNAAMSDYLGQGGAQQYQQTIDQARQRLAGMPQGPARDAEERRLQEMQTTGELGIKQGAQNQARSNLMGLTGLEQGYTQQDLSKYQGDQSNDLGWYGAKTQRMLGQEGNALGWGQLGLQGELGRGGLNLQQQQFADQTGAGRNWAGNQAQLDRQAQMAQIKANKPSTFQTVVGALSDLRAKENIEPSTRGLAELRSIPAFYYNYKFDSVPRHGVMAQDVEKVAPELVHEYEGLKTVDVYGLLTLTMNAVKELDKKIPARKGKK